MRNIGQSLEVLGLTLAQYAAFRGQHPQGLRDEYRALMRRGAGLTLPEVSRRVDDPLDGTTKFCLPLEGAASGSVAGPAPAILGDLTPWPQVSPPAQLETESVIIPMTSYRGTQWYTLCISSQVGCRMGCTFCETGRMGLLRNLTPGEIVRQRLAALRIREEIIPLPLGSTGSRRYFADGIQNIVFMGMGEPLDNLEHVVQAIRVFSEPLGMNFPHAQITVSTVGRVDGLRRLAALGWRNLRIAISLNAGADRLRDELMPINKGMPLAELKRVLLAYPLAPKGRFLMEYVLIKDLNDSAADARAVADFCRDLPCIVNVIPYNPQRYAAYETPSDEKVLFFMHQLKGQGIFVKRRITHGRALMGACGQLGNPSLRRQRASRAAESAQIRKFNHVASGSR